MNDAARHDIPLPDWYNVKCETCGKRSVMLWSCAHCGLNFCRRHKKSHLDYHNGEGPKPTSFVDKILGGEHVTLDEIVRQYSVPPVTKTND